MRIHVEFDSDGLEELVSVDQILSLGAGNNATSVQSCSRTILSSVPFQNAPFEACSHSPVGWSDEDIHAAAEVAAQAIIISWKCVAKRLDIKSYDVPLPSHLTPERVYFCRYCTVPNSSINIYLELIYMALWPSMLPMLLQTLVAASHPLPWSSESATRTETLQQ
jgi:hypothetical protein